MAAFKSRSVLLQYFLRQGQWRIRSALPCLGLPKHEKIRGKDSVAEMLMIFHVTDVGGGDGGGGGAGVTSLFNPRAISELIAFSFSQL